MSDYSFMKSGRSVESSGDMDVDTMHKLVALVKTLMEDALKSAEQFVYACGRTVIQDRDITMALKYETHEFLLQGESLDSKFQKNLQDEMNHTYETDDDEDSSDDEWGENEGEDEKETYTLSLKSNDPKLMELHGKFMKYHDEWPTWDPEDPISKFMKNAVDKTSADCAISF
tara:strand:- start:499 stop:1014 length:516 start_codon:yes stop_codon:yes gene_type:complete